MFVILVYITTLLKKCSGAVSTGLNAIFPLAALVCDSALWWGQNPNSPSGRMMDGLIGVMWLQANFSVHQFECMEHANWGIYSVFYSVMFTFQLVCWKDLLQMLVILPCINLISGTSKTIVIAPCLFWSESQNEVLQTWWLFHHLLQIGLSSLTTALPSHFGHMEWFPEKSFPH